MSEPSSKPTSISTMNVDHTKPTRVAASLPLTEPDKRWWSTNESSQLCRLVAPCGKLFGSCPLKRPILGLPVSDFHLDSFAGTADGAFWTEIHLVQEPPDVDRVVTPATALHDGLVHLRHSPQFGREDRRPRPLQQRAPQFGPHPLGQSWLTTLVTHFRQFWREQPCLAAYRLARSLQAALDFHLRHPFVQEPASFHPPLVQLLRACLLSFRHPYAKSVSRRGLCHFFK